MRENDHEPRNAPDPSEPPTQPAEKREVPQDNGAPEDDAVTEASEDSFPASDAPPWTSSAT